MLANWAVIAENWPLFCEALWNFLVTDVTFEWLPEKETLLMPSDCSQKVHLWQSSFLSELGQQVAQCKSIHKWRNTRKKTNYIRKRLHSNCFRVKHLFVI